jgi:hypothetical protein
MKKLTIKKLHLVKVKVAKLTSSATTKAPTYTGCSLFRCPPPPQA